MSKIRALIIDDSIVIRRVLEEVLGEDPDLEVCGLATNGQHGVDCVEMHDPDVVVLDVEMPIMTGLETLAAIRRSAPRLPVLMLSVLTERAARATLEALSQGATDYVTRPAGVSNPEQARSWIRGELVPKIRSICRKAFPLAPSRRAAGRRAGAPRIGSGPVRLVVVGLSTGGPRALDVVVPAMRVTFPVPVIVVQHMPPLFTRFLAARLNEKSRVAVAEARDGERPAPGQVWIARGDHHLEVDRDEKGMILRENRHRVVHSCRPSVDVLFRSAADRYGSGVLGVVLTGMGRDGLSGCERIYRAGGQVIVQDERTSVVWGMPGAVARAAFADAVVPIEDVEHELTRRVRNDDFPGRAAAGRDTA